MFTVRYRLIPYIQQITFSFKKVNLRVSKVQLGGGMCGKAESLGTMV